MIRKSAFFTALVLISIIVLPVLGGCSRTTAQAAVPPEQKNRPPEISPSDGIDGSHWKLITLDGNPLISGTYISLYFHNGTFWGYSGLNTYGAEYSEPEANTLVFSDGIVTLLGGPDNVVQQEKAYLEYFHDTASYKVINNHLEITSAAIPEPLVFERLPEYPMNPADLIGTSWRCVSLNGERVSKDLTITLSFGDTQASGQAGCFDYELPYETSIFKTPGDDIRWGMICRRAGELSPELEQQAGLYTTSIGWAANFLLIKDKLELYTARGETIVFKPLA
jgi:heat shock protein HslJ